MRCSPVPHGCLALTGWQGIAGALGNRHNGGYFDDMEGRDGNYEEDGRGCARTKVSA